MENMLSVEGLSVSFSVRARLLRAVRGVDLTVPAGETLAVVGESGCGKSALAKAVMGLTDRNGRIDAGRVTMLTFTFGAVLAALGGALVSPTTSMVPGVGASTIVLSFAVIAIAGLGRIEGAAISALMIGLGRSVAIYFEPELEVVVPYLIMVAVLLVRPQGLFGTTETRRI